MIGGGRTIAAGSLRRLGGEGARRAGEWGRDVSTTLAFGSGRDGWSGMTTSPPSRGAARCTDRPNSNINPSPSTIAAAPIADRIRV
jgi:hypothetical protein